MRLSRAVLFLAASAVTAQTRGEQTSQGVNTKGVSDPAPFDAGPRVSDLLLEYAEIERRTLASLTSLEATAVQDKTVGDEINATRAELQGIAELTTIMRFVLQREEELVVKEAVRKDKAARLGKLQRTLELLRLDNDARARAYLDRLDASIAPTDRAARAFARAQAAIFRELAAWEAKQAADFANATERAASGRRELDDAIARLRADLRDAYLIASAAKRLVDDWPPPRPLLNASALALQQKDIVTVDTYSPPLAALRRSIAAVRAQLKAAEAELAEESAGAARLGLDVNGSLAVSSEGNGTTGNSSAVGPASTAVSEALASASRAQMERLEATVRHLLSLNAARQLNDGRPGGRRTGPGAGESSLRSWTQSSSVLEAEIAMVDLQRTSLERARKVLEEELARRAARAGRLAVLPGGGAAGGAPPLPPGGAALLAAADAAGGIGPGESATEVRHSPVIQELLEENGLKPLSSVGINLGTGSSRGRGRRGGCEFCVAQRNIGRLEDELGGLRIDLRECVKSPAGFKPNCAPRLRFQIDRLSTDLKRRKLVRGGGVGGGGGAA